nr:glycoside hydrolase family 3 protein [Candidatus Dependentiae bacterium]
MKNEFQRFIGQLFIIELKSTDGKYFTEYNEYIDELLKKYNVGGFIFFSGNIIDKKQLLNFIRELKKKSETPLFIAVDEEGAPVSRLRKIFKKSYFSHKELGEKNNPELTYQTAFEIGTQIKKIGFNIDFAPVMDIFNEKKNCVNKNSMLANRTFGNDLRKNLIHTACFFKGLEAAGIISCPKHFPGCGDAVKDLHKGNSISLKTFEDLSANELKSYKTVINLGCKLIMIGHNSFFEINEKIIYDGKEIVIPSSLSKNMITGVLKKKMNYKNLIVTDSLRMNSIAQLIN